MLVAKTVECICFHAFTRDEDGEHYTDAHEEADGWCVYTRAEPLPGDPGGFDLSDIRDFDTRDEAEREALRRAEIHGVEAREY